MSAQNEVFWTAVQTGEVVPLAIGSPGTGKTKSIEAFGRAVGRPVFTLIGSISEPTDFGGFPMPVQCEPITDPATGRKVTTYMSLAPAKWAVDMWDGKPWILFLDELTTNSPPIQAAMLRVITDKRVGDLPLPQDTWICSACNPSDQAANGHELEPPMANRLMHWKWEPDCDGWDAGMISGWSNIAPRFTPLPADWRSGMGRNGAKFAAFRRRMPSLWSKAPDDRAQRGGPWPSPRSWTNACTLLTAVESFAREEQDLRYQAVSGCIGDDATHQWSQWEKTLDLPDPEKVLQDVIEAVKAGRAVNGEVPDLARADQALAFLGALCDRVMNHDCGRERWEAGMEVVGSMWKRWKDLTVIGAQPMVRGIKPGWNLPEGYVTEAFPLMVRAGMFEGGKT